jgi:hypothetical protein
MFQAYYFILKLLSLLTFLFIFDHSSYSILLKIIIFFIICFINKKIQAQLVILLI